MSTILLRPGSSRAAQRKARKQRTKEPSRQMVQFFGLESLECRRYGVALILQADDSRRRYPRLARDFPKLELLTELPMGYRD
jgi:hypothetical protein